MARTQVAMQSQFPYHVSGRCVNREWFSLSMDQVWLVMAEQLYFIRAAFGVRVISFVLMSNHFHMIVLCPEANLDKAMGWFMRESSRSLAKAGNRINQSYGGRYFRSILSSELYFLHAYKYVYLNPVAAGMVKSVLDYRYSSLPGVLGFTPLLFPVFDDRLVKDTVFTLGWLNQLPSAENWERVRRALRKKEFRLPCPNKLPHPLEEDLL